MPLLPSVRFFSPAGGRRLRQKTTIVEQLAVVGESQGQEADPGKGREVYLVSLSHPLATHSLCGKLLRAPEGFSREDVRDMFLASCDKPVYMDARSIRAARPVPVKYVSVY